MFMIKRNRTEFIAEINHVMEESRFKESGFMCVILQGETCIGDVVQFLDAEGNFIVEQAIDRISHSQRTFETVKKGETNDDIVYFLFKHISEYPIQKAKYIIKMNNPASVKLEKEVELPINNYMHYNQLINKAVDIDDFINKFYIYPLSSNLGYYLPDIYAAISIECLRETEQGALYSVHKVAQGGLLYIFYARIPGSPYIKVADWYYVKKRLSLKDFQTLRKGSSLQEVITIDPAAKIYEKIYETDPFIFNIASAGLNSFHYLTDGVLKIQYKKQNIGLGNEYMQVDKIKFVNFDNIQSIQPGKRIHSLNGRVLPLDMIC